MEVVRGTHTNFEAEFVDINGTPLVPANPETYPIVTVRDPDGDIISTGTGTVLGDGLYRFAWFVPEDAEINTNDTHWSVSWVFVTSSGHTKQVEQAFDVVDRIEDSPEDLEQTVIVDSGESARVSVRWPIKPYSISLDFRDSSGAVLWSVDGVSTNSMESDPENPNRLITEVVINGEYVYYYDTGPLNYGEYQAAWNIRESIVSNATKYIQIIRAVPGVFWHYATELRIFIDKMQKRSGVVQAYTDSDLYSHVMGGLDIINFYAPTTTWTLTDIPLQGSRGVRTALLYASAVKAIQAQQILDVDLDFNHSGQTVTLTYSHDWSNVLSALQGQLDKFAEAKPQLFRLANGAAFSGGRPKNYRFTERVFRMSHNMRGVALPLGGPWQAIGL